MARRNDGLTPRQRQSRQIMEEKAALKRRKALLHKLTIGGGGLLCVALLGGGAWMWKSGALGRSETALVASGYSLTARCGFAVQGLYLEGRSRTSMAEIEQALGIRKGDPILRLSLDDLRQRLEKIESIRMATVERDLPGTLHVRIVERQPVARWQHEGKVALVDDNGVVMNGIDSTPYQALPLVVGDDAPQHVKEILAILASQPKLAARFAAAVHVGERRWNIDLSGNASGIVEVKLPEDDPAAAWKTLADLEARQQVLDRDVKVIDLRLPGKMFIRLSPDMAPGKTADARET